MLRKAAPYALMALGLGTAAFAQTAAFPLQGWPRTVVSVGSGVLALAAGAWIDYVRGGRLADADADRREKQIQAANLVGLVLALSVLFPLPFPTAVRMGVGGVWVVVLLGSAYAMNRRERRHEYDERELEIRYRAAYNGFLVVNGLLITAVFVLFAVSAPVEEEVTWTTSVMVGAFATMASGVLAFKLSEGWYGTRM